MKRLALSLLLVLPLAPVAAARQASTALTCAAASALVRQQGALLFDTSATTFDRYVRDASFCVLGTRPKPAWIPTRDTPQCMVGYSCEPDSPVVPFTAPSGTK